MDNNILYIDDEIINLQLFEAFFSKNYSVSLAHSTKEAEELIAQKQFKVILSDISMPNESGLDFFKRVHFEDCAPILIILTAFVSNNLLLEALNQGRIFRYLTKPMNREEVQFTIDLAIQTYDLIAQNKELNKQIHESERNFHSIFQHSQDSIVIIDENHQIMIANHAFGNLVQLEMHEICEKKITDLLPPEIVPHYLENIEKIAKTETSVDEYYFYTIDKKVRFVEANNKLIDYQGHRAVLSIIRDITERKYSEQKILNAVIHAEEKERSRIAKDLHDGLGPIMATLKMYLEWLSDKPHAGEHPDILNMSLCSVNEAIVTLKSVSNNLSPHILEKFGLISALTSFIDKVKRVSPVQFVFEPNFKDRFELMAEISLYRILTECINNSIKHSKADQIQIVVDKLGSHIVAKYSDNGIGFDFKEKMNQNNGLGLANMQNRIKTLGGKIAIHSALNRGTQIIAEIPNKINQYGKDA